MGKRILSLAIGAAVVILGFLSYFISKGNFEFLGYAFFTALLIWALLYSDRYVHYPTAVLWLFIGWMFLHFSGGAFYFNGVRLYDLILINLVGDPFHILKYDQAVHAYCYFVISIIVYFISMRYYKTKNFAVYCLIILAALGVSAINEIIEFGMVIWLDAGEAVGGYYNTLMDFVMNFIGAILGVVFTRFVFDKK